MQPPPPLRRLRGFQLLICLEAGFEAVRRYVVVAPVHYRVLVLGHYIHDVQVPLSPYAREYNMQLTVVLVAAMAARCDILQVRLGKVLIAPILVIYDIVYW